jgi:hypothetical protein
VNKTCKEKTAMDFRIVWLLVFAIPLVYIALVGKAAHVGGEVDERSRGNYFEAAKTLVTAAGVAIAIVAAGFQQKFLAPAWILRRATVCLSLCVVLSVMTMLEMSRSYEEARRLKDQPVDWRKLLSILVLGYFALVTFFLGFAYLARLTFYI